MDMYVECGRHRGTITCDDHKQAVLGFLDDLVGNSENKITLGEIVCVSEQSFDFIERNETYFETEGLLDELGIETELFDGINYPAPAVVPVFNPETGNIRFDVFNARSEMAETISA